MNRIHSHLIAIGLAALALALTLGCLPTVRAATVDEALIREKVTAHVYQKLALIASTADRQYTTVSIPRVPGSTYEFPAVEHIQDIAIDTESPLGEMYSDRIVVRVKMSPPDGETREIGVPVRIMVKKPVWVVKNPIDAKIPLTPADLELQLREVSRTYSHVIGEERPLNGYIARVNLRPGELLDSRKIVLPPDVLHNADVRIILSNGKGMQLTVPGIALSDGRIGQTIQVRQLLWAKKAYNGKVISRNKILVEI